MSGSLAGKEYNSFKVQSTSVIMFMIVPLSYLVTYGLRLGEAAYYGIPFSLVTVTISDFFDYLLPSLLVLLMMILVVVLLIKKAPQTVKFWQSITIFIYGAVYLFAGMLLVLIAEKFVETQKPPSLFIVGIELVLLFLTAIPFIVKEKIGAGNTIKKVLNNIFCCAREVGKLILLCFLFVAIVTTLLTIFRNIMAVYYFFTFVVLIAILFLLNTSYLKHKTFPKFEVTKINFKFPNAVVLLLAFFSSVLCVMTVVLLFSLVSLEIALDQEKLMTINEKGETLCVLAVYENDYAVGVSAESSEDGGYHALIPENGNFQYYQLSNSNVIFEASCDIENENTSPFLNAVGAMSFY